MLGCSRNVFFSMHCNIPGVAPCSRHETCFDLSNFIDCVLRLVCLNAPKSGACWTDVVQARCSSRLPSYLHGVMLPFMLVWARYYHVR